MKSIIDVRRFHKPLADAGLVPDHCRVVDMSIGVSGAFTIRYEVMLTAAQLVALGEVFKAVGLGAQESGQ
jgi:hypothetical protein